MKPESIRNLSWLPAVVLALALMAACSPSPTAPAVQPTMPPVPTAGGPIVSTIPAVTPASTEAAVEGDIKDAFAAVRAPGAVTPAATHEVAAMLTPAPDAQPGFGVQVAKPSLNVQARATTAPKVTPTAAAPGKVIFSDDFSSASKGKWLIGDADTFSITIEGGQLHIQEDEPGMIVWTFRRGQTASDFRMEVDGQFDIEAPSAEWGLMLRKAGTDSNSDVFLYGINQIGEYYFLAVLDGEWVSLIPATPSDLIQTDVGAVNHLAVEAVGSSYAFFINGVQVDQIEDESAAEGLYGVYAAGLDDPEVAVSYDNFVLSEPGGNAEPTPAPTPRRGTPTPEPGGDVFTDDFSNPRAGGWQQGSDDAYSVEIHGGKLYIDVLEPQWTIWSTTPNLAGDFQIDVDSQWMDGAQETELGLIVRMQKDGGNGSKFYTFAISPLGYYSVWARAGGKWTALVDWTPSDAVLTDYEDVNHLRLVAVGEDFAFYCNDEELVTLQDAGMSDGYFGVYGATIQADSLTVAFDNFRLAPPE